MCVCVRACLSVCLSVCLCPPLKLLITGGVILTLCDCLNKFYSFYVAIVIGIISRRDLSIDACHENQPKKHKLVLYKLSNHLSSS